MKQLFAVCAIQGMARVSCFTLSIEHPMSAHFDTTNRNRKDKIHKNHKNDARNENEMESDVLSGDFDALHRSMKSDVYVEGEE